MSLFFIQLRFELSKLFARRRTYVGFVVFLAAELLIFSLLHMQGVKKSLEMLMQRSGYLFADLYTGPTLAFIMLTYTASLLGGLYLALVSGDLVSKEVEDGTLRMILCRPISRARILALKYLTCLVYTFSLSFFIVGSSVLVGILFQGAGELFVYAPFESIFSVFSFEEGLIRFGAAAIALGVGMQTISTIGFTLSCMNMKPATATIITLSVLFVDSIVRTSLISRILSRTALQLISGNGSTFFRPTSPGPKSQRPLFFCWRLMERCWRSHSSFSACAILSPRRLRDVGVSTNTLHKSRVILRTRTP